MLRNNEQASRYYDVPNWKFYDEHTIILLKPFEKHFPFIIENYIKEVIGPIFTYTLNTYCQNNTIYRVKYKWLYIYKSKRYFISTFC